MRKLKGKKKSTNTEHHEGMTFEEREKLMLDAVEQQLQSEETIFVKETLNRLIATGVSDKDAKSKIVEKFIGEMYFVLQKHEEFNLERYKNSLIELI